MHKSCAIPKTTSIEDRKIVHVGYILLIDDYIISGAKQQRKEKKR